MEQDELERRADVVQFALGRRVVVAGPGSGKTRLLVERIVALLAAGAPPSAVLTLVFNRRAAAELRRRVAAALPDRGLVELRIATFHSFALTVTDRFWRRTDLSGRPALLPTAEQRAVVRTLLERSPDPDGWPVAEAVRRSPSFSRNVADALLRAQEQLRPIDEIAAEDAALARSLTRYRALLAGRARLDHAGLLAMAATLVDDAEVRAALAVDHLLVDEYQDVNRAQELLVERLASSATSAVVVGDPDQAIYAFRGATRAAMARATTTLRAEEVRLTAGFRCPQAVLDAAASLTTPRDRLAAVGVDAPGGVGAAAFAHRSDELTWVAEHVRRLVADGAGWDDVAILCRSLRSLRGPVTSALQRAGVPYRVGGGGRAATAHPWVVRLLDLLGVVAGPGPWSVDVERLAVLETAAVSPLVGAEPLGLREAFRAARRSSDPETALTAWAEARAATELGALLAAVQAARRAVAEGADVATVAWVLWSRLPARARVEAAVGGTVAAGDLSGGRAVGAWHGALAAFVDRHPGTASVREYLEAFDDVDGDGDDTWLADGDDAAPAVQVLTVHQAKGLEFRHVIVPALEEGRFPVAARCSGLGTTTVEEAAAEERRLLYVALTRAAATVTLTATLGTEDRAEATPSRFFSDLAEHLVDPASLLPAPDADPLVAVSTAVEARRTWGAALRRREATDEERVAAAHGLRVLAGAGLDEGNTAARSGSGSDSAVVKGAVAPVRLPWVAVPTLAPTRDLRTTPWRLSASSIATYLGCGRQFLFDRVLRLSPWQEHAHGAFGTAVHAAISGWLEAGEAPERSLLEGRLAEAFAEVAEAAMALGVQRESFRRRLPTIARHVAEDLVPELGTVVRIEGDLAIDGPAGVRLIARPDLVTTATATGGGDVEDGIEVVDWKTGSVKSKDASGDVQLAVYHHVVGAALGAPVRRLRLAYVWGGAWAEQPVTLGHEETTAQVVRVAADGITGEHFEVGAEPPCRYCAAQVLCDRQPRGQDLPW
jgi:superfamily I DNA/RNA helicase